MYDISIQVLQRFKTAFTKFEKRTKFEEKLFVFVFVEIPSKNVLTRFQLKRIARVNHIKEILS
jgi:hypothetical protein